MTLTIILVIIGLGLLLLLIEVLVIPGTALVGIVGAGLMIAGVWSAYASHGNTIGHYVLLGTALSSLMLIYFALKSNTWKKLMLNKELTGKVPTFEKNLINVGDTGTTLSRLAPIGKARINDEIAEVQSTVEMIDENQEITVVKIDGAKILVKLKNN
jgi:membrane-bound ClpP family serine protease